MARMRDYDEDFAAYVVERLMAGVTFRGTAYECGASLGMVQRIWREHIASLSTPSHGDGESA